MIDVYNEEVKSYPLDHYRKILVYFQNISYFTEDFIIFFYFIAYMFNNLYFMPSLTKYIF